MKKGNRRKNKSKESNIEVAKSFRSNETEVDFASN